MDSIWITFLGGTLVLLIAVFLAILCAGKRNEPQKLQKNINRSIFWEIIPPSLERGEAPFLPQQRDIKLDLPICIF